MSAPFRMRRNRIRSVSKSHVLLHDSSTNASTSPSCLLILARSFRTDCDSVKNGARNPPAGKVIAMTDAIRAETVRIAGHDGDEIEAYLAQPLADGPFGAVVVIHHFPGYDEETKEITRRFADHGYLALCPNLYSRQAPGATPDEAAAVVRAQGGIPDEQLVGDVDGSARHLKALPSSNGKVGTI